MIYGLRFHIECYEEIIVEVGDTKVGNKGFIILEYYTTQISCNLYISYMMKY